MDASQCQHLGQWQQQCQAGQQQWQAEQAQPRTAPWPCSSSRPTEAGISTHFSTSCSGLDTADGIPRAALQWWSHMQAEQQASA